MAPLLPWSSTSSFRSRSAPIFSRQAIDCSMKSLTLVPSRSSDQNAASKNLARAKAVDQPFFPSAESSEVNHAHACYLFPPQPKRSQCFMLARIVFTPKEQTHTMSQPHLPSATVSNSWCTLLARFSSPGFAAISCLSSCRRPLYRAGMGPPCCHDPFIAIAQRRETAARNRQECIQRLWLDCILRGSIDATLFLSFRARYTVGAFR